MDVGYWDRVAGEYEAAVLNPLTEDLRGVLRERLDQHASNGSMACDYGCGPGRWLKRMAGRFAQVHAVDFSAECLTLAKHRCRHISNITYERRDLTRRTRTRRRFEFASCINVLLTPASKTRLKMLRNIHRELACGGRLMLVVPSLESGLFAEFVWHEWDLVVGARHGRDHHVDAADGADGDGAVRAGVLNTGGAATKHFLREELSVLLDKIGFENVMIEKVEYAWSTEFDPPPRGLRGPHPWDWLATARKT